MTTYLLIATTIACVWLCIEALAYARLNALERDRWSKRGRK